MLGELQCRNCGCEPSRRSFRRKDYCCECFYLCEYIKDVEAWDFERPETHKHIPRGLKFPVLAWSKEEFAEYKSNHNRELKAELNYMRHREAKCRGEEPVDGLTIEEKLGHMLSLLRRKVRNRNAVFHSTATSIDQCFNQEQRRMLFRLLDEIEVQGYRPIVDGALARARWK